MCTLKKTPDKSCWRPEYAGLSDVYCTRRWTSKTTGVEGLNLKAKKTSDSS